ncbi:MAG: AMP-binding protein [Gammaproteobacteria bacterium]
MNTLPLLGPGDPDAVMVYTEGEPYTRAHFLAEVIALADELPDRPTALNLVRDRYHFLVTFAAALLRGQTTLLPPTRAPTALAGLAQQYPASYCLTDGPDTVQGLAAFHYPSADRPTRDRCIPEIPSERTAAVVFTSGTSGVPKANRKTWGALSIVARRTAVRFGLADPPAVTVVATVPHHHMFGLETSIMLPLQCGLGCYSGKPLFPEDILRALQRVPAPRVLVTTPLHLRACLMERTALPALCFILCATAPLARAWALEAETMFDTSVHEIYGCAEAGSVATRRTVADPTWQTLDGIRMCRDGDQDQLEASYLPRRVPFPDRVTPLGAERFLLHGRPAEEVNIGGRRTTLADLDHQLNAIDGVRDGAFFLPPDGQALVTRLVAFAVAPGKGREEVLGELRKRIDSAFLPRPLYLVEALPRNETGKLPREGLSTLEEACRRREIHGG